MLQSIHSYIHPILTFKTHLIIHEVISFNIVKINIMLYFAVFLSIEAPTTNFVYILYIFRHICVPITKIILPQSIIILCPILTHMMHISRNWVLLSQQKSGFRDIFSCQDKHTHTITTEETYIRWKCNEMKCKAEIL